MRQRLVRLHPVSQRTSLFLSSHIGEIEGWPVPEARMFFRDLAEHATQREHVYSHRWQTHDLVMWDNRSTIHLACHGVKPPEIRRMHRTTILGEIPF